MYSMHHALHSEQDAARLEPAAGGPRDCRKVTVFGGDGFLGSYFVEHLATLGHEVTVFDRFRAGSPKNIGHLQGRCRMVPGDLADLEAVAAALEGQEVAVHLISCSSPVRSWDEPLAAIDADLRHSVRLFELCVKQGLRKIVFASSGGTLYGQLSGRIDETAVPRPFNPHGIAKLAAENFLRYFRERAGIAADCYRIGNLYGPRQPLVRDHGVIAAWTGRILAGQPIDVYGNAGTVRDYVFARDAAWLMTRSLRDLADSGTFNLGTGRGTSILELLDIFKAVSGRHIECHLHPRRRLDNTSSILVSDKLLRHFPGFAFHDLTVGVAECLAWARQARQFEPGGGRSGMR